MALDEGHFLYRRTHAQGVTDGVAHLGTVQRVEVEILHPFTA